MEMIPTYRRENMLKKYAAIFILVPCVSNVYSAPLDTLPIISSSLEQKAVFKRSPEPFDLRQASYDPSRNLQIDYDLPIPHTSHHVEIPSKSTTVHRGPSVQGSAIDNLIEVHDHPDKLLAVEDVIVALSDFYQGHVSESHHERKVTYNKPDDENHVRGHPIHKQYLRVLPIDHYEPEQVITSHPNLAETTLVTETDLKIPQDHLSQRDMRKIHKRRNTYRDPVGGFGTGLKYGGHGAGHGFYVHG